MTPPTDEEVADQLLRDVSEWFLDDSMTGEGADRACQLIMSALQTARTEARQAERERCISAIKQWVSDHGTLDGSREAEEAIRRGDDA